MVGASVSVVGAGGGATGSTTGGSGDPFDLIASLVLRASSIACSGIGGVAR